MGINAVSGPSINYGITTTASGAVTEYNEQRGPCLDDLGTGFMDPRPPYNYSPGNAVTSKTWGFWEGMATVDAIPTTISTNSIAAAQQPVASTNLTLVSAAGSNVTAVNVSIAAPEGGTATGLLAIDGDSINNPSAFGQAGTVSIWSPTQAICRGISIVTTSNLDAGTLTIAGRDQYGYKVTEQIVMGAATTYNSQKCYKYISAIKMSSTVTSTGIIVGVQDKYEFPLRVDSIGYLTVWWGASSNATLVSLSTGAHTFAFGSSLTGNSSVGFGLTGVTATATTADVRGTFTSSAASNSTAAAPVRLFIQCMPSVQNLQSISASNVAGLFGVTQFSSV